MRYSAIILSVFFVILHVADAKCQSGVKTGIQIGNKAPEINGNSVSGQPLKLSALSGKIVLIDFWASWCRPCRNENPFVVSAYEKYKGASFKGGKGFTVFSVSLDRDPDAWKKAIQTDHLNWGNHICAPSPNVEYVQIYGIRSIPSNFLIDGNGLILASNLRGEALEQKLASLIK